MCSRDTKSGVPRPVTYGAQGQQTGKLNRHKTGRTHRVPSSDGGESFGVAALVRALRDVVDEAHDVAGVKPGVQKAKRFLAFGK